jgi:iron complex transport system substrate-binding protein
MQTKKEVSIPTWHLPNEIQYAKGFEIYTYEGYSIVKLPILGLRPKNFQLCFEKKHNHSDSLKHLPISHSNKTIVVTSTTIFPRWKC